jgi:hypothetical protein
MSSPAERLALLSARAEIERGDLAAAMIDLRREAESRYRRITSLGFWAGTLAAGATSAYRFFGRNSLSSRVNRWSAAGSIVVSILRFLFRLLR